VLLEIRCALLRAEYDEFFSLSRRKFVLPNFAEIRHVLNIAQVGALSCGGRRSCRDPSRAGSAGKGP
jgi:hypothetical protein